MDGFLNYIPVFAVLFTYVIEHNSLPSVDELLEFIEAAFRGIDMYHQNCIQEYVECARFKMKSKIIKTKNLCNNICNVRSKYFNYL